MPAELNQSSHGLTALVRFDQIVMALRNHRVAVAMNCAIGLTVAWEMHDQAGIGLWIGVLLIVNTVRYSYMALFYRRFAAGRAVIGYVGLINAGSVVSGLIWSVVPFWFMQASGSVSSFVMLVLCGVTAGAMVQSTSYAVNSSLFISPILLTIMYRFATDRSFYGNTLPLLVLFYFVFLLRSAARAQTAFCAASLTKHEAVAANVQLYQLANHDPLTGLLNRAAFSAALDAALVEAAEHRQVFSLYLLDLDHFKSINDTLGHGAGDMVLMEVAARLRVAVGPEPTVARLGGDEFAVILRDEGPAAPSLAIATRVIADTCGAFSVAGSRVTIGVSLGIARYPEDAASAADLLAYADLALYGAKDTGRQRCLRFDGTMLAAAEMARDLELDLPAALADGALEVWYQPQIALAERRLVGLEALVRWKHPRHGWIAPPMIVAAALKTRISIALTSYVLSRACQTIRRLTDDGRSDIVLAVNVSPAELDQYELPDLVRRTADQYGIAPRQLELEITEESFVSGDGAITALRALSSMGFRIAIDDFGTGFSSIGYLRGLRFDRVKIDRGFISGIVEHAGDRLLVKAILDMMRSLDIEVVAEGIETREAAVMLQDFGCGVGQGYFFGRPSATISDRGWPDDAPGTGDVVPPEPIAGRPPDPAEAVGLLMVS